MATASKGIGIFATGILFGLVSTVPIMGIIIGVAVIYRWVGESIGSRTAAYWMACTFLGWAGWLFSYHLVLFGVWESPGMDSIWWIPLGLS